MNTWGKNLQNWLTAATGMAVLAFSGHAVADNILSLSGDNGAVGIADVSIPDCSGGDPWADVTVSDITYGTDIPDESSTPDGEILSAPAPAAGPNAQRNCISGAPGEFLRALDGTTPISFTGSVTLTLDDQGGYTGDGGGTYKIRTAIPEPGSLALLAIGLGAAGAASLRRRRRSGRQ